MSHLRRGLATMTLVIAASSLTGCDTLASSIEELGGPSSTAENGAEFNEDYYTITGPAQQEYEPEAGAVSYCDLDELDRAVCAYAELTGRDYDEREDINFDPPGFTDNAETDIPALSSVPDSKDYHGWFYNRSHLIADSLGASAVPENMVTGTRTQNVGSTQIDGQSAGGMAHTELIARDYIDSGNAKQCPLYYAATPNYDGDELVPRTVTVDIRSCDGDIDERVEVANSANGHEIDYSTGAWEATS